MMPRTLLTALALIVVLAWLGPSLDDNGAEFDQAADIEAAQHDASAQARYDAAVQRLCGENAAYMELADGAIQCKTKRGMPTRRVTLTAQVTP
jgi:hypothetical protein